MGRWYAKPDDLIGGWAVMNVDLTPGQVSDRLPGERAHMREIANFVTREDAEEIARLHNDAERVSRLLWLAREGIDVFADLLSDRNPGRGGTMYGLVDEIDAYRAERGWSACGFGGELGEYESEKDSGQDDPARQAHAEARSAPAAEEGPGEL